MPKIETTETTENNPAVPTTEKTSAAASRILRAVEKSRGETTARLQLPAPAAPVSATPPQQAAPGATAPGPAATPEKVTVPKLSVDAREALRSLSDRQTPPKAPISIPRPAVAQPTAEANTPPASKPEPQNLADRTVAERLQAAKPAVTSPVAEDLTYAKTLPKKDVKGAKADLLKEAAAPASRDASPKEGPVKDAKPAAKAAEAAPEVKASPARSANPVFEAPTLGMGPNPSQSFWANLPMVVKAGFAVLILGGAAGFLFKFSDTKGAVTNKAAQTAKAAAVLVPMSGIGGWTANWGDPNKMNGRSISMFRPSLQHSDYRIEFEAQIESKAFGWVFRAKDPQNYHGYKVETVKPGLQPLVALARVSVVAGVESQKHYTLLEGPVRPDTVFRVRMDARDSEFTTWINGQLIEVWQDDRLRLGGVGLFTDMGERAQVRKVQIFEMR